MDDDNYENIEYNIENGNVQIRIEKGRSGFDIIVDDGANKNVYMVTPIMSKNREPILSIMRFERTPHEGV